MTYHLLLTDVSFATVNWYSIDHYLYNTYGSKPATIFCGLASKPEPVIISVSSIILAKKAIFVSLSL